MMTNARKLTDVFRDPFVAAEDEDDIYNLLTMEVISQNVYKDIIIGMRQDWTTHVSGIHHRTLHRWMTLCVSQNHKEEAQTFKTSNAMIEMNAAESQIGAWTVGKPDRHLNKQTKA